MTSSKYALKAEQFVISNPTGDATIGQMKQIDRLIRADTLGVKAGNVAVEKAAAVATRHDADTLIKWIARKNVESAIATVAKDVKVHEATANTMAIRRCQNGYFVPDSAVKSLGKIGAKRLVSC
jgi:predicted transposase YbfD/YdcC